MAAGALGAPSEVKRIECLQGSRIGTLNRNLFTRYLSGLELPSRIKLTCNQLLLQPFYIASCSSRSIPSVFLCVPLASSSTFFSLSPSVARALSILFALSPVSLFHARIGISPPNFSHFSELDLAWRMVPAAIRLTIFVEITRGDLSIVPNRE